MSLYREAGRERRRRRMIIGGALGALILVVALIVLLSSGGETTTADRAKTVAAAADRALDELELVGIEYEQAVRGGRVVAQTEFTAAVDHAARARKAITDHAADVRTIDPAAPAKIDAALAAVADAVQAKGDVAAVTAASDAARPPLIALRKAAEAKAP